MIKILPIEAITDSAALNRAYRPVQTFHDDHTISGKQETRD